MPPIEHILLTICGVVFSTVAVVRLYLKKYYLANRPRTPQSEEGRTYPIKIDGVTVYLSDQESYWLDRRSAWTFLLPLLLGMLSILVGSFFH